MIPIQRILVPTDFSEPASAALTWAATLAREFGANLSILHVVPEPYAYPWGTELSTLPLHDILAQSEAAAAERLSQLAAETGLAPDRITVQTAVGTPVDRILAFVADERVDLIVIGTHGRGMVGHLLLGSVAERVVRRAPVPVLTVHGAARDAALRQTAVASATV